MKVKIKLKEGHDSVTINTDNILYVTDMVNVKSTYNLFERLLLSYPKQVNYWRFRVVFNNEYLEVTRDTLGDLTLEYERVLEVL